MTQTATTDITSAIKEITTLASQARSVSISKISPPADSVGLPGEIPVAIRHGASPELLNVDSYFERFRTHPARKSGTAKMLTLKSFIDLTNRHKTADSAVFANTNWEKPGFVAVIDYHEDKTAGLAAFAKHRIAYDFPLSEEWKKWVEKDGEPMDQGAFAAFLEDRIAELSSPMDAEKAAWERDFSTTVATPAELIRLSRGLQVNVESRVKANVTLASGAGQISWEEDHKDSDGKPILVPGMFCLSVAPFFMGDPVRVPVRLRYRVRNGAVVWFYQIYRPDVAVTTRVLSDLAQVVAETALPAFEGAPEA